MAMLAERRSKSKWVLNPRGSNAINEMQFGRKMLEKMGWQSGEGLGANKQGAKEPLRVQYKNDVKGIGYKKNVDNEWLKVENEFSKFLQDLSSDGNTNADGETNIESLEKKSEGSKARLHYRKFTRNKDLSRYSEKDLSCILGFGKNSETPEIETAEEDGKFFDKGCMNSYFERMTQKKIPQDSNHEANEIKSADQDFSANEDKMKSGKKNKKAKESLELSEYNSEEVRGGSKRKKSSENLSENSTEGNNDDNDESEVKIKKIKKKIKLENSVVSEILEIEQNLMITDSVESQQVNGAVIDSKNKKNKSKKRKFHQVIENDDFVSEENKQEIHEDSLIESNENNSNTGDQGKKRKKKKVKFENELENSIVKTEQGITEERDQDFVETFDQLERNNRKEKNRDKKKKSNEIAENNCVVDSSIGISNDANQNDRKKYKKNKSEEINETEAIMNVQILDNDDSLRIGKGSKRKEKNKWKKRKHNDLKENGVSDESSEEISAGSCYNSPNRRTEKTKSKKDKNLLNENVLIEKESVEAALLVHSGLQSAQTTCDILGNNDPQSGSIDRTLKRKSKKSKAEKLDEIETHEKEIKTEKTEVSDSVNSGQKKERKDKSNETLKSKIKIETGELFENKVEGDSSSDNSERKKMKKSKKKKFADKDHDDNITENETEKMLVDFNVKKVKVECDDFSNDSLKKKKQKSKKSKSPGEEAEETTESQIPVEENEKSNAATANYREISEATQKSKSKKRKTNYEEDEAESNLESQKSGKMQDSVKVEVSNFNGNKINDGSFNKPVDKKAKLLALLEKATKDDSDDSDSDSDSNSMTNLSSSCFKGSNFEKIPGYRNVNAT